MEILLMHGTVLHLEFISNATPVTPIPTHMIVDNYWFFTWTVVWIGQKMTKR